MRMRNESGYTTERDFLEQTERFRKAQGKD
jgi:hypothetical protein